MLLVGVQVLFEEKLIEDFVEDRKYDKIIKTAILNHNKPKIEDGLDERTFLHSKLIRDADKTDIFYNLTFEDTKAIYNKSDFSDDEISEKIYQEFLENRLIDYNDMETSADILVAHFSYLYDFNYKYGLQHIYENGYIDKLYGRFTFNNEETMKRYNEIYELSKNDVEKMLNNK